MVDLVAFGLGATIVLSFVAIHFARGTEWRASEDISQELLDRRASTVPETDFPEPMNRSIGGGGGAVAAVGGAEGEEAAELEGEDDGGFDPSAITDDEVEYFEVEFEKEGETIELANNKTVLEQGEDAGMDLPYACRQGQCVSCAGHITSGGNSEDYVRHDNQQMLDDGELDEGYTLTCVAYPISDFTIETGEAP
ncbi:2Fe-2S iron-sulfur cluster-binding protein [Halalkalirubrum salinum]|uniref:2Fe-2S iron-sulfur cluster-binding protein n=2 Tax=Haloferacaceae TaxID=1644056 RepID=UPI0010FBA8E6|nr:2Fe-2S iron-sulfur cluster-binding protein [Halalkalirubrum salinum]